MYRLLIYDKEVGAYAVRARPSSNPLRCELAGFIAASSAANASPRSIF